MVQKNEKLLNLKLIEFNSETGTLTGLQVQHFFTQSKLMIIFVGGIESQ